MRPLAQLLAVAVAAALLAAPRASAACETVVYQEGQPETRAWVSGHYEWIGDTWGYVPGHWEVTRERCRTTEIDSRGETVVYVERPSERIIVVDPPPCERRVVYVQPVYRTCERRPVYVQEPRRTHVDVHLTALPLPIPFPVPFPLFRHHH